MSVVLVNPPPEQIIEEYDAPEYPHIGIGYLASSLELSGFSPIVVDAKLERLSLDTTVNKILSMSPTILGVTAMTHEITFAHTMVTRLKNMGCNATMVIGGIHITTLPEKTLQEFPNFDVGVIGEGEHTIVEICEFIVKKRENNLADIPGVVFRTGDGIVLLTSERPFINNLDSLSPPAWHLFPPATQYPIITARGCPARCIFCIQSHGHTIRERSPENIFEEWEHVITAYSPRMIIVHDESFGFHKKRVIEFLDLVIERDFTIPWFVTTRAHIVSPELLHKMKKAGCFGVGIGVESGDADILKSIRKGITLDQVKRAIKYIHDASLESHTFFILGFPNETIRSMLRTIRFAARLNSTYMALGIIVPYPGTEIARMADAGEGGYRIIAKGWKDYNKQIGNAIEFEHLSRRQMELFQLIGYVYFYLRNGRIMDFIRFALRYRSEAFGFLRHFLWFRRIQYKHIF
jgi:radical SAM superfamily enzyme YgiQ (UPF0313 family)